MRDYNRKNRSPDRGRGGGNFRRGDFPRRDMHKAVCDNCGNDCEVPFKPTGDRPIYCSNCFEEKGGGRTSKHGRRGSGRTDFGKRDNTNKQLLEGVSSLNTKLDRILRVIESKVEKKTVSKKTEVKKVAKKATSKVKKAKLKKARKQEIET